MSSIKKLSLITFIVALITATSATSCNKGQKQEEGDRTVFYKSFRDDAKTLDPANAYDTISLDMMPNIYETLYQYAYLSDTYKIIPLLAADLPKFSKDRLTLTIPLKRGIKFADNPCFKETSGKGRELKASDFVYAFKRLALPAIESQGWWIFDAKVKGINDFHDKLLKTAKGDIAKVFAEDIEGLKAIDDYTLQIKLIKPYPQLLYTLAMGFTSPVAPEAIAAYGDENGNLIDKPVGTGPYVLKEWSRGQRIILEKNPNYHSEFYPTEGSMEARKQGLLADAGKPLPFIDKLAFSVIKEQQPQWLNFLKGELDEMTIPKDNFSTAIQNQVNLSPELASKGIRLSIEAGVTFFYISFNGKDKLVGGNKYLRQAMSSAIDREKWIEIFTNGRGRKQTTALPPGIPDRPANPKLKYDFNLTLAKELLKKSGYPEGRGLPVINFDMRGADSVNRQMGEFFSSQWGAIGIKINPIYNTFPAYLEKAKQGNLQVSYGGWSMDYPDGENVYQLVYGKNAAPGPNESNFNNPEMNSLYEKTSIMESGPARAVLIKRMDDILQEEVPWALGFYSTAYTLSQPWLLNFRANEIILNKMKYYRINKDVKRRYQEVK